MDKGVIEMILWPSSQKNKKFMVEYINPDTGMKKKIHFGAKKYSDYTISGDEKKKVSYIAWHSKEDWETLGPGQLAWYLLWEHKSLGWAIALYNIRFKNRYHIKDILYN